MEGSRRGLRFLHIRAGRLRATGPGLAAYPLDQRNPPYQLAVRL